MTAPTTGVTPDAYLSANSAGVTARLCSDGAFWLRRSGFLLRLLLSADAGGGGGDGLAGALGDEVGHRVGRWWGRLVRRRRVGQRVLMQVERRRDEVRGERRWRRRRLRYMYSGRLLNRARAVFCQRLRGVHTRRLNFVLRDPERAKDARPLYTPHHPDQAPEERLSGSTAIGKSQRPATWENADARGRQIAPTAGQSHSRVLPDARSPPASCVFFSFLFFFAMDPTLMLVFCSYRQCYRSCSVI